MLKKHVEYYDFNGKLQKEDVYLHINKVEQTRILGRMGDNITDHIKKLVEDKDTDTLIDLIEKIILIAYGKKSDDGRQFIKTKEETDAFSNSEAYAEIFGDLITHPEEAEAFWAGVSDNSGIKVPSKVAKRTR